MNTDRQFFLVYPERRWVTESKIRTWYADAVANNEVDNHLATRVETMIRALEDAGLITTGYPKSHE